MSDAPLCACGQPSPHAVLCRSCTAQLGRRLAWVASIAPDLEDAVARQLVRGSGGKRSEADPPMPLDDSAMKVRDELRDCLSAWVRAVQAAQPDVISEPHSGRVSGMAAWLAAPWQLRTIRQARWAEAMATNLQHHAGRAAAAVDQRPERIGAGRCELCRGQLWMDEGGDTAVCGRCGEAFAGIAARRLEAAAKADVIGTPPEIAGTLGRLGVAVSAGTIRMWASRGRLVPRPGGGYALSDVMDLAARRAG